MGWEVRVGVERDGLERLGKLEGNALATASRARMLGQVVVSEVTGRHRGMRG